MPINKDAITRYRVLDKCFRNIGRNYTITDLIAECDKIFKEIYPDSNGISRRQIYNDIHFMESGEGWNIELDEDAKDGRNRYYRYTDPNFSIDNMPINETLKNYLRETAAILSHFKGMTQFEWVQDMLQKLDITAKEQPENTVVDFERNANAYDGRQYFSQIYNAIINKKVLKIKYQPYNRPEMGFFFHPYYLKQSSNRWYALGYSPNDEKIKIWVLGLERIQNLKETNLKYKISNEDWDDYFSDIVGVTRPQNGKVENVIIHAFGITAKYLESKPFHESQKAKMIDKNTLEIQLKVIVNIELEKLLLSNADNIKIISPKSLVKLHKAKLQKALARYEK